MARSLFPLGQIVSTPGALEALRLAGVGPSEILSRHQDLDPGVLGDDDQRSNREALVTGARVFSAYLLSTDATIWVITEAVGDDGRRASTCLLLPDEY